MREIIKNTGSVYFSSSKWNVLNSKISDLKPSTIFILVDSNTLKHCLTFLLNKLTIKDNYKILYLNRIVKYGAFVRSSFVLRSSSLFVCFFFVFSDYLLSFFIVVLCYLLMTKDFRNIPWYLYIVVRSSLNSHSSIDRCYL